MIFEYLGEGKKITLIDIVIKWKKEFFKMCNYIIRKTRKNSGPGIGLMFEQSYRYRYSTQSTNPQKSYFEDYASFIRIYVPCTYHLPTRSCFFSTPLYLVYFFREYSTLYNIIYYSRIYDLRACGGRVYMYAQCVRAHINSVLCIYFLMLIFLNR